jgi:hypothetical protein
MGGILLNLIRNVSGFNDSPEKYVDRLRLVERLAPISRVTTKYSETPIQNNLISTQSRWKPWLKAYGSLQH